MLEFMDQPKTFSTKVLKHKLANYNYSVMMYRDCSETIWRNQSMQTKWLSSTENVRVTCIICQNNDK